MFTHALPHFLGIFLFLSSLFQVIIFSNDTFAYASTYSTQNLSLTPNSLTTVLLVYDMIVLHEPYQAVPTLYFLQQEEEQEQPFFISIYCAQRMNESIIPLCSYEYSKTL